MWVIDTSSRILSNSQILRTFWMKMISLYNRCHPEWSVVWEKIRLNNYRIVLFLLWCPFVLHPATTRWSSQYGVPHLPPKRLRFPIIIRRWLKMNRSFRIAFTQKNILTLIPFFFVVDITIDHGHGIHFFLGTVSIYTCMCDCIQRCVFVCVYLFIYVINGSIYRCQSICVLLLWQRTLSGYVLRLWWESSIVETGTTEEPILRLETADHSFPHFQPYTSKSL